MATSIPAGGRLSAFNSAGADAGERESPGEGRKEEVREYAAAVGQPDGATGNTPRFETHGLNLHGLHAGGVPSSGGSNTPLFMAAG